MRRSIAGLPLAACACVALTACGGDTTGPAGPDGGGGGGDPGGGSSGEVQALTDAQAFARATADVEWTWYKRSTDTLAPAADSPHHARLRTRYDPRAAAMLDEAGKVVATAFFPDSSVIVKEVYGEDGALVLYAVMVKQEGDPNAGHGDWLWAEYATDGNILHSVTADASTCHDCHLSGIDHTRMNEAHP